MTLEEMAPPPGIVDLLTACDKVNEVYGLLDQAELELEVSAGHICIDLCGKCCEHNTPVVSMIEVVNIVSYIGNFKDTKPYVANSLAWLEHKVKGADSRQITNKAQLAEEVEITQSSPCPFLDSDTKGCAIWAVRPLVCRSYGVTVPADDWCPAPGDNARVSRHGYLVARDTNLGVRIQQAKKSLFDFVRTKLPDKAMVGFLPMLLAQALAAKQYNFLVSHQRVADAKLSLGVATPDLFWNRVTPPETSDAEPLDISPITIAGDYNFETDFQRK